MDIIPNRTRGDNDLPFETPEQLEARLAPLRKEIAKSYEVVMEICRQANAPEAVRLLIDSLIRLSDGKLQFEAYDYDVARIFFEDDQQRGALKKKVYRWRKKLAEWQDSSSFMLVRFNSGGQRNEPDGHGNQKPKNFPCTYQLVVLDLASKVLAEDIPTEKAARKVLGELAKKPTHINEKLKRPMTTERARNTSLSMMRKALDIAEKEGHLTEVIDEVAEAVVELLAEYKEGRTDSSHFESEVKTNDTTNNTLSSFSNSYNTDNNSENIGGEDYKELSNINNKELTMKERAIDIARLGFRIFPVHSVENGICSCDKGGRCENKGKHPRIIDFQNNATTDESKIKKWWRTWRDANIGIPTGERGNENLVVLDVDPRHGGFDSLERLADEYGELPESLTVITGSGGRHYIFSAPSGVKISNVQNNGKLGNGLDIRGEGGFIVAAGSIHHSGNRYEWEDESVAVATMPTWMIEKLTVKAEKQIAATASESSVQSAPQDSARFSNFNGSTAVQIVEGERNGFLFSKAIGLFHNGYGKADIEERIFKWNNVACLPPLSTDEVAKLIKSAERTSQHQIN
jgi:hypothetical protein